jgi:hypothetical protein
MRQAAMFSAMSPSTAALPGAREAITASGSSVEMPQQLVALAVGVDPLDHQLEHVAREQQQLVAGLAQVAQHLLEVLALEGLVADLAAAGLGRVAGGRRKIVAGCSGAPATSPPAENACSQSGANCHRSASSHRRPLPSPSLPTLRRCGSKATAQRPDTKLGWSVTL